MKSYLFNLFNYDLWADEENGYVVNDVFLIEKDIVITEDASDEDIIRLLKRMNIVNKFAKNKKFNIDGEFDYTLYVDYNGDPVCELRCTKTLED